MSKTRKSGLKIGFVTLILLISVFSVFMLTACVDKIVVDQLSLVEDTVPDVAVVGGFNISDVKLIVTTPEGNKVEIAAENSMLTTEARNALATPGQQSITLYYQQKTVTFSLLVVEEGTETVTVIFLNADGQRLAKKSAIKDGSVTAPVPPDVAGKVFVGWVDYSSGNIVDLTSVSSDVTVAASYAENATEYTVRFIDYKNNIVSTRQVRHGEKIAPPSWSKPSELSSYSWGVDFSTYTVTNNVDIHMTVEYVERTVEYFYAFQSKPEVTYSLNLVEQVRIGGNATLQNTARTKLTQQGLNFIEWQNTSTVINTDTKMVAIVEDRTFTISYKFGDHQTETFITGTSYTLPSTAAAKEGYVFNNQWKDADGNIYEGSLVVSKDLVLEPVYNLKLAPVQIEITFKELKIAVGTAEDRKETINKEDTFYGDTIDHDYINELLDELKRGDAALANYEIESIKFGETDVTLTGAVLGEVSGNGVHRFTVVAVDKEKPTAGLIFTKSENGEFYSVTAYEGTATNVYIPAVYDTLPVAAIGAEAFKGKTLNTIVIPSSVTSIGDGAFSDCVFYDDIVLPDLVSFGNKVFANAVSADITTDDGVSNKFLTVTFGTGSTFTTLDGNTFNNSKHLSYIILPASVKEITDRDITEYKDGNFDLIVSINLDNVEKIGAYAFYTSIVENVGSLANVNTVGAHAFDGSYLSSLNLPNVKVLGEFAFAGMPLLTNLSIATETVFNEGEAAFAFDLIWINNSVKLAELTLGKGVKTLTLTAAVSNGGTMAFANALNCPSLAVINLSEVLTEISSYYKNNGSNNVAADSNYELFVSLTILRRINIASGNEIYATNEGVLYELKSDKTAVMVTYPRGKTGDYTVPSSISGHTVIELAVDFNYVTINTLRINDEVIAAVVNSGINSLTNGSVNSVINLIISADAVGNDFVAGMTSVMSVFNLVQSYHIDGEVANFDKIVEENGWASSVFVYNATSLSRYDAEYDLVYRVDNNKATVLFGDKNAAEITVPATLGGVAVTEIADGAFANYGNLVTLNILATLNGLSNGVLKGCNALLNITVASWSANAVVDKAAFKDTEWLKNNNLLKLGGKLIAYNGYEASEETGITTVITAEDLQGITIIPNEFFKDSNVSEVTLPSSVVSIGASAFANSALTAIDFNAVRIIGEEAFKDCKFLETANLKAVVTMGKGVFSGCVMLESAILPNQINNGYLPVSTFEGCLSLTNVTMPYILNLAKNEMGASNAFANCISLENIDFAKKFSEIPDFAFSNCSSIKVLDFTVMAVTAIGDSAFASCEGLEYVQFSSAVSTIGTGAFYGCTALKSIRIIGTSGILASANAISIGVFPSTGDYKIYIPAGASDTALNHYAARIKRDIPGVAFSMRPDYAAEGALNMPNLIDTIYIDEAPEAPTFENYLFSGWYYESGARYVEVQFPYIVPSDGVTLYAKYYSNVKGSLSDSDVKFDEDTKSYFVVSYKNKEDDVVYIPSEFEGKEGRYPISTVFAGAFSGCANLISLEIPEGVKYITIGGYPEGETDSSYDNSLSFNAALKEIYIPSTVEAITGSVFAGLNDLNIVFAADSLLTDADKSVFEGSKWYIEQSELAAQGRNNGFVVAGRLAIAYEGESKLVEIPSNVYKLADGLFENNVNIEEVVINDALAYIGDKCFTNATSLRYVTYASGSNQNSALIYANLESFNGTIWKDAQNMVIIGTILAKYNDLHGDATVNIPDYITEISKEAFMYSEAQNIVFGANSALKKIGDRAFKQSKITSVNLPAVTEMGQGVFEGCLALESADLSRVSIGRLPDSTFNGDSKLSSLSLSADTTALGISSLEGCVTLKTINADGITDTSNLVLPAHESGSGLASTAFYNVTAQETDTFVILGKVLVRYLVGTVVDNEDVKIVEIPDGVEIIISKSFYNCKIVKVILPASVKEIESHAFGGSALLEEVAFSGAGLVTVGESAFADCTKLSVLVLPNTVETIGVAAFARTVLSEADIPDSVTSIGKNAYNSIATLEYVRLGNGLTFIGEGAFAECNNLFKISWSATPELLDNLNEAIGNYIRANLGIEDNYSHDLFKSHIAGLFHKTQEGRAVRMYLNRDLFNYIENIAGDNSDIALRVIAWKESTNPFKLYLENDFPLVSFESGQGYHMSSFNAEVIESIGVPAKTDHTFVGWYLDGSYSAPLVLPYSVYRDITLYAKWFKNDLDNYNSSPELTISMGSNSAVITGVNTNEEVLYIPSTVAGLPLSGIEITGNAQYETVKKIVLTNASAFNGLKENIFRWFPNLESIELIQSGTTPMDMKIEDGVLYSADGSVLIAYLARYDAEGVKETIYTVPNTVTEILPYAFINSGLKSIVIGDNVAIIGEKAFNDGLEAIEFSQNMYLTEADSKSFDNTAWYKSAAAYTEYVVNGATVGMFYSAGNMLLEYKQIAVVGNLVIPNTLKGYNISVIASYINIDHDQSHYSFENLTLPSSLVKINSHAFYGIDIRQNIVTDSRVLSDIADEVFSDTTFYKNNNQDMLILGNVLLKCVNTRSSIVVPEGIVAISNDALTGGQVNTITLPSTLRVIGDKAFYGCDRLTTVNIPDSVTSIGNQAFAGCSSLASVGFNAGTSKLVSIGRGAFTGCRTLTSISVPYTVESIGDEAFLSCGNLTTVNFDYTETTEIDGVITTVVRARSRMTELGASAFENCSNLTAVSIPNGLTAIRSNTFYGCTSLANVTFDVDNSKVKVIEGNAFFNCISLGGRVNLDKPELVTVVLPNSLETLKQGAFENCQTMLGIRLNYNVKLIESNVFAGCLRLTKIEIYSGTPAAVQENAFRRESTSSGGTVNPYFNLRIYVNDSVNGTIKNNYKSAWTAYADNIYQRSELPLLTYRRTVAGSGGSGGSVYESAPVYTDLVVDPTYQWGNTTYSTWIYTTLANYDETGAPQNDTNAARFNSNPANSQFSYQQQTEGAVNHLLLILDYDVVHITNQA